MDNVTCQSSPTFDGLDWQAPEDTCLLLSNGTLEAWTWLSGILIKQVMKGITLSLRVQGRKDRNPRHLFELANLPKTGRAWLIKEDYLELPKSPEEDFCHLAFSLCWFGSEQSSATLYLSPQTFHCFTERWFSSPLHYYPAGVKLSMVMVIVGISWAYTTVSTERHPRAQLQILELLAAVVCVLSTAFKQVPQA